MESPLRVLVVEDSVDDAELILLALRRGGLDFSWERVETAAALQDRLTAGPWDIVLSDYPLPDSGAESCLRMVRAADPDLPFIVVSGLAGEETAVLMMRSGANDYLLKDALKRLPLAVEREVDAARNRRSRRAAEHAAWQLAAIVQSSDEAIIATSPDGRIMAWNPAAERLYGWTAAEAIGQPIGFHVPTDRNEEMTAAFQRAFRGERTAPFETVRLRKDGTHVEVAVTMSPIRDAAGRILGGAKIARDITGRKKTEEALRESEKRFQAFMDHCPALAWIKDENGTITFVNRAVREIYPIAGGNIGRTDEDFFPPEVAARIRAEDQAALAAGAPQDSLNCVAQVGGPERWWRTVRFPMRDAAGRRLLGGFAIDVTRMVLAEQALRLRDHVIQSMTVGVLITDPNQHDNPIIYANAGFERLTGYTATEVLGRNSRFLLGPKTDPQAVAEIRAAVKDGRPCSVELLNYRRNGSDFWSSVVVSPVRNEEGRLTHFIGVLTDITTWRKLEEQFRHAQKMEAIGQLAGGVAHDFNNLLVIINGYSELLLQALPANDPSRRLLNEIHKAGERSAGLTRQLLAFSRMQVLAPRVLNLNEVVADTNKMLRRLIGEDIHLDTILAPDLWAVRADPGQIEQVLMNLAVNARDAMPCGGRLTIATRNVEVGVDRLDPHLDGISGRYVLLSVMDTGCGIAPDVLPRIFEPFFTTKEIGKGTGLGLATVYGIIKQSGGHIAVESEPGVGTIFKLYLPFESTITKAATDSAASLPAPAGKETVLLVEDEATVRALTYHVLVDCGYVVLEAANGEEAIRIADTHQGPIDLLISDVVMPGVGARVVADQVARRHPGVRSLFVSGYTDDAIIRHGILSESVNFMRKPFSPHALACRVREVLDGDHAATPER